MKCKVIVAAFLLFPVLVNAALYNCLIEKIDRRPEKTQKIWAGVLEPLPLNSSDESVRSVILVIRKDGREAVLGKIISSAGNKPGALKKKLKTFQGLVSFAIREENEKVDIALGHVDTSRSDNMIPYDASAWSSAGTKFIGVKDFRRKLAATCTLQNPLKSNLLPARRR
jgi:hypothetical protein